MDQDTSQSPEEQHQPQPSRQDMVRSNGDSNDTQRHNTGPEESGFWRGWAAVEYTQAIFSGVLVVATLVNMFVSCGQWQVAQDSLRLTQRAVESTNIQAKAAQDANELTRESQRRANDMVADADRPWVGVYHVELGYWATEKKIDSKLQILNSGKTPAFTLTTRINWQIIAGLPEGPPAEENLQPYEPQGPLFPNQGMDLLPVFNNLLPSEEINNLQSGTSSLIIYGSIMYTDRLKRSYGTNICAIFNVKMHQSKVTFCPKGNTAW